MQRNVMKRCFFFGKTLQISGLFSANATSELDSKAQRSLSSTRRADTRLNLPGRTLKSINYWLRLAFITRKFAKFSIQTILPVLAVLNCLYPVFLLILRSTLQSLNLLMCSSAFSMCCWKYLSLLTKASNIKSLHLRV